MKYPKREITIRIKNPRLQKIRNEFRKLIWTAAEQRIMEFLNLIGTATASSSYWDSSDPLYTSLRYESMLHHKEQEKLRNARRDSITWCSVCDSFEKDMIYRPAHTTWFCTDCSAKIPDIIPD
ncbi:MAG: hypothetical protein ACTSV5_10640 [Promethearchaeota archaeon]